MKQKAIIFGVTGQDGSYLAEFLLEKGYFVIGVARRASTSNTSRIDHLIGKEFFVLESGDVLDFSSVYNILWKHSADEVYNLAAQSHVGISFEQPIVTWDITAKGCLNILEGIVKLSKKPRFYQASSSEMFGGSFTVNEEGDKFQNETTMFNPQSPYAIAKLAAHNSTELYRKTHDLHASCGILFNHESERRGENFVTKKISSYVADLSRFLSSFHYPDFTVDIIEYSETHVAVDVSRFVDAKTRYATLPKLGLGNLEAYRDWGYAKDYVRAMWLMLQQDEPDTYVIATGETYSVKDFVEKSFAHIGITDYDKLVKLDKSQLRPSEVPYLKGDYSKAKEKLGWTPEISFEDLVSTMVQYDIERLTNDKQTAYSV
jgi:GDPmannose 4,6-dehydratase